MPLPCMKPPPFEDNAQCGKAQAAVLLSLWEGCSLAQSVSLTRYQPQDQGQPSQDCHKVSNSRVAMFLRSITSKQPYHHSCRHQAEYPFTQRITQSGAHQQD